MLQVLENFNTSHVTVYHEKPVEYDVKADYFNTSHVTVYQIGYVLSKCTKTISIHLMLRFIYGIPVFNHPVHEISIHLMLRFIKFENIIFEAKKGFQYISCYGLS